MAELTTPPEVLIEFLRYLRQTIDNAGEPIIPVLRGSLLLRHWFGESARPAGDIDLECFERPPEEWAFGGDQDHVPGRFGRYGEYDTLVDFGKAMCRYAAEDSYNAAIRFVETEAPPDGASLWTYGTPGERYYSGWQRQGLFGARGQLQIDVAQAGSCSRSDLAITDVRFVASSNVVFDFPCYAPETMLAAKLSWLMRSFQRRMTESGVLAPRWSGEPKDLFDAHLLLTQGKLRPDVFQRCFQVIGIEDKLAWNNLEAIFDVRRTEMNADDFVNWDKFYRRYPKLVSADPVPLLETIADRLEPLLGDFYLPAESPFLLDLEANPIDESTYRIYADWLEDQSDPRGELLRLYTEFFFQQNELSEVELGQLMENLRAAWRQTSVPWLLRFFGSTERYLEAKRRFESAESAE